ncbi:Aldehyde dehydrogenase (NAD(+)) [Gordonia bronchialis DSM 43247]|uniref:Aldehyde dehydrogenase (NAD(+)) n=1 Tax=Gordonia bronchialis (strain ATCC 25592 / DSM 43247 / BCRC 13721 / JCM 3198 / KCTC 3076 / NBRC 16047 / NCTC 10667) TaxID=526226 RepID=D0L395_GORB4|nr:aldehyde dehydrogenase [Gordonia bronchialis]ACY23025.1 Aldehyde dehydrogenase (NAD(+)) [Gordonia bronchialis DSM 43247]MCC3325804.1 aldehyde dehydrogenase [Gordonia bronchialis]QGS23549.1 aldehyde dehydrogenase [Gordonia bronchialis]STQ65977.1 Putative aldehyde dehydrogenase SA1924 [Gordonia bronchialis]
MPLRPASASDLLIDGKQVAGSGSTFDIVNPATEEIVGQAADATAEDMSAAIAAARNAFDTTDWSRDHALRARFLRQLRDALLAHADEFREITVAEVGCPVFLTHGPQLEGPITDLGYFADLAETYEWTRDLGEAKPMGLKNRRELRAEAAGVVGAITPWNFPHQINFAKIGPALAAGCTVVLKPAPDTPWCAALVGKVIAEETDFPPGVINIVTSSDHALGAQLATDPRVDIVSFTGSTATGKKVMAAASESLKKVFLELGGKSAFIVLDDADLASACSMAAFAVVTHAGQGCAITTRLLVPRSKLDEATAITRDSLAGLAAGDPTDSGTICGPVISAAQRQRVESYIELARSEGGTIEIGGGRPAGRDRGFFVEPTLISGLDNTSRVAQEEVFGPVLVIIPHDGDDDAIRIANDSPYGLSGQVWGTDEDRINKVVNGVRTGTMAINGGIWYSADVPFGGYKQSGIGREMGVAGFEEYLETKAVARPA